MGLFLLVFERGKIMPNDYKEVYFDQYCKKCEHKDIPDDKSPCHECLDEPVNLHSHKPVKFEEDNR